MFDVQWGLTQVEGELKVYILWWYRCLVMTIPAIFAVLQLRFLIETDNNAIRPPLAFTLAFLVWLVVRFRSSATVRLTPTTLIIGGWKPVVLSWSDISSVRAARGSSAAMLPWRVPVLKLKDGDEIYLDEIRALMNRHTLVEDVVADIQERISDRQERS